MHLWNRWKSISHPLAAGLLLAGIAAGPALADPVQVQGTVVVEAGKLPEGARVRATPSLGGPAAYAPILNGGFVFPALEEGTYRFEIVLVNQTVFAEAGVQEVHVGPGDRQVVFRIQQGRTGLPARAFWDWAPRTKALTVAGGAALAAVVCAAADCFDNGNTVSPSSP